MDLNTLLSFNEDLTGIEIENFVAELDSVVQKQGYETAFQMAIDKIHEYPTCEAMIYSVTIYLEGALFLYNVQETERYRKVLEKFYKQLSSGKIQEIRDTAIGMLISYTRNRGEYSDAEELINTLSFSKIDKEEQLAILYQAQKKYADSEKLWEHRILNGVTEIQTALINMIEIALYENRNDDADIFADMYEAITCQFYFPEWQCYNAHLQLALKRKDKEKCLSILVKMLPAMKKGWNPQHYRIYRYANGAKTTYLSSKVADSFCEELNSNDEFAFLRDSEEFRELMKQMG